MGTFAPVRSSGNRAKSILAAAASFAASVTILFTTGCFSGAPSVSADQSGPVPTYVYQVVNTYPHDRAAFTQGLFYLDGFLYEGTGLPGHSSVRKVKLETGEVVQQHAVPEPYFGEGIVNWGPKLLELTWQSQVGFVYKRDTFEQIQTFTYPGEGWGLTQDGKRIIMSDGTPNLRFWNPDTLQEAGRITVHDGPVSVPNLNELEYIKGEIYANVWQTDRIARISPSDGRVTGWIDLEGLLTQEDRAIPVDVLNGIAYDAKRDRLFVTGKLWPKIFEIKLVRRRD